MTRRSVRKISIFMWIIYLIKHVNVMHRPLMTTVFLLICSPVRAVWGFSKTNTSRCDGPPNVLRRVPRWSTWPDVSAAARHLCRAQRVRCVGPWVWWLWPTRSHPPRWTKSAWRATCLSSEWTWTFRSRTARTGEWLRCQSWADTICCCFSGFKILF